MRRIALACLTLALALVPASLRAQDDSVAVRLAVAAYHTALEQGDSTAALAMLVPEAVVLESGGIESRAEYRTNHLAADIAFAQATTSVRNPGSVFVRGDVAWAAGTSETRGEWNGNPVASAGAELMVLVRTPGGWRIAAIHWSSRRLRE